MAQRKTLKPIEHVRGALKKHARDLAKEVRDAGYEVRLWGEHQFLVWPKHETDIRLGTAIARFNSHPKHEGVLGAAQRDLRRLGILPGGKGVEMPTVSEDVREATPVLRTRMREQLEKFGGDSPENRKKLAERAVEILRFRNEQGLTDVEQFGSTGAGKSPPRDVARESIRGLLDMGVNATEKSLARWQTVLDEIGGGSNGQNGEAPAFVPEVTQVRSTQATAPEPVGEPIEVPPDGTVVELVAEPAPDVQALRQEYEQLLAAAEEDLQAAERRAEDAIARADRFEESVAKAREEAAAAAGAVKERDKLQQQVDRLLEQQERLKERAGSGSAAVTQAEQEKKALQKELKKAKDSLAYHRKRADDSELGAKQLAADNDEMGRVMAEEMVPRAGHEHMVTRLEERIAEQERLLESGQAHRMQYSARVGELETEKQHLTRAANEANRRVEMLEARLAEVQPRRVIQDALLVELRASNGAPHAWLLDRLDKLAGI